MTLPGSYRSLGRDFAILALCILAVYAVLWSFTGTWPWMANPYNNYALQAEAWLHGRLDLGKNHPHLELALFQGRYYVSFPPFPSLVLLPFALFLGSHTPDHLVTLAAFLLAGRYALLLYDRVRGHDRWRLFWVLFLLLGGSTIFVSASGWVWFMAQTMALALMLMALYYATGGKAGRALFFLACAVGCRPFQACCLPLVLLLLYRGLRTDNAPGTSAGQTLKPGTASRLAAWLSGMGHHWWRLLPSAGLVLGYLAYNAARFGNILEFGHNYLPEFLAPGQAQFSLAWVGPNLASLFRLPGLQADNLRLAWPVFNGFCIFLASPLWVSALVYGGRSLVRGPRQPGWAGVILLLSLALQTLLLLMHRTMGGWHFGHRYLNDLLPLLFLALLWLMPRRDRLAVWQLPLLFLGLVLNVAGSIAVLNNWI